MLNQEEAEEFNVKVFWKGKYRGIVRVHDDVELAHQIRDLLKIEGDFNFEHHSQKNIIVVTTQED